MLTALCLRWTTTASLPACLRTEMGGIVGSTWRQHLVTLMRYHSLQLLCRTRMASASLPVHRSWTQPRNGLVATTLCTYLAAMAPA